MVTLGEIPFSFLYGLGTSNAALVDLHIAPELGTAIGPLVPAHRSTEPILVTTGQPRYRPHLWRQRSHTQRALNNMSSSMFTVVSRKEVPHK